MDPAMCKCVWLMIALVVVLPRYCCHCHWCKQTGTQQYGTVIVTGVNNQVLSNLVLSLSLV